MGVGAFMGGKPKKPCCCEVGHDLSGSRKILSNKEEFVEKLIKPPTTFSTYYYNPGPFLEIEYTCYRCQCIVRKFVDEKQLTVSVLRELLLDIAGKYFNKKDKK